MLLWATVLSTAAKAEVEMRVEARPISAPIQAFITVTDDSGNPVPGLSASDFTVLLDGAPLDFGPTDLTLPPAQNSNASTSVIFVMDYSSSTLGATRTAIQDSVVEFINTMRAGDYAAIIKFNGTRGVSVVQPFTAIDDGAANDQALTIAANSDYDGSGTNLLDALDQAVALYVANDTELPLPAGPKAIIVITDGGENQSTVTKEDVAIGANAASLPVFTIAVGNFAANDALLDFLPTETGGDRINAPSNTEIGTAYATISQRLDSEYVLTFQPEPPITDCSDHTLGGSGGGVDSSVAGQLIPATTFSRCSPEPVPTSGGGGGGSIGVVEILLALGATAIRRRRRPT